MRKNFLPTEILEMYPNVSHRNFKLFNLNSFESKIFCPSISNPEWLYQVTSLPESMKSNKKL